MKRLLTAALALALLSSTSSMAQFNNSGRTEQNRNDQGRGDNNRNQRDRNEERRGEENRNEQRRGEEGRNEQRRGEEGRNEQRRGEENRNEQRRGEENRNEQRRGEENRNEQRRGEENRNEQRRAEENRNEQRRYNQGSRQATPRWSRGDRLPDQYRQRQYIVSDWQRYNLRKPPHGYHWVQNDYRNYFLVVIGSGVIRETRYRDDHDHHWRQRYNRIYSYDDDVYYRECRNSPDPAGIIVGGLIGGLLGNAAGSGGGRTGATIAGVVIGGAIGAALTNNLDCEDRSYAYRTYYDGFTSGRPNSRYHWRNPRSGNRGDFIIGDHYDDEYGFRCTNFTQNSYIGGRPQRVHGRACQQPDGAWAIVG